MCSLFVSPLNDKNKSKIAELHEIIHSYLVLRDEVIYRKEYLPHIADLLPANHEKLKTFYSVNPYESTDATKSKDKEYTIFAIYLLVNYINGIPEVVSYVDRVYETVKSKYDAINEYLHADNDADILTKCKDVHTYKFYAPRDKQAHAACIAALENEFTEGMPRVNIEFDVFKKCVAVAFKYFLIHYSFDKATQLATTSKIQRYLSLLDCTANEVAVMSTIINLCLKAPKPKAPAGSKKPAGTGKRTTKKKEAEVAKEINVTTEEDFNVDDDEEGI